MLFVINLEQKNKKLGNKEENGKDKSVSAISIFENFT